MFPAGGGLGRSIRRPPPPGAVNLGSTPAASPVPPTSPACRLPRLCQPRPCGIAPGCRGDEPAHHGGFRSGCRSGADGAAKVKRPPRPSPVVMTKDSEQQRYLESLKRQARHGRRRSWWLGLAAAGVILVTIGAWLLYQASTVLRYAQLAPRSASSAIPKIPNC